MDDKSFFSDVKLENNDQNGVQVGEIRKSKTNIAHKTLV